MALQFSKKAGFVGILVGAAVVLHFGNHLLKPLVIPKKKQEDINAQMRKTAEGV